MIVSKENLRTFALGCFIFSTFVFAALYTL
jgi:hypothetical protein